MWSVGDGLSQKRLQSANIPVLWHLAQPGGTRVLVGGIGPEAGDHASASPSPICFSNDSRKVAKRDVAMSGLA